MELIKNSIDGFQDTGDLAKLLAGLSRKALEQGRGPAVIRTVGQVSNLEGTTQDQVDIVAPLRPYLGELIPEDVTFVPAFFRILLDHFLCYSEFADYRWIDGHRKRYLRKYLMTSNAEVAANYLGISTDDEEFLKISKHLARPATDPSDPSEGNLARYVRFEVTREGTRKVVKARSPIDLAEPRLTMVPWPVLEAVGTFIKDTASDSPLRVVFQKDSGEIREIDTSFDMDWVRSLYGDGDNPYDEVDYVSDLFRHLHRGYVRVPELGASRYDATGARSINISRVLSVIPNVTPDLRFLSVDLNCVVESFTSYVLGEVVPTESGVSTMSASPIAQSLYDSGLTSDLIVGASNLVSWSEESSLVFSTTFHKALAGFMLDHPDLFPGYSGAPLTRYSGSSIELSETDPQYFLLNF